MNREVLKRIKETGDIFMAWEDREWTLDGAAVRISIIAFDDRTETERLLNGSSVSSITPDLKGDLDLTHAHQLIENTNLIIRGIETGGPFEISSEEAFRLRNNPQNMRVLVPTVGGKDITARSRQNWLIDFAQTPDIQPETYTELFSLVRSRWEDELKRENRPPEFREAWWRFRRSGEELRNAIGKLDRFIVTPRVAKHRLFVWLEKQTLPDSALFTIARSDDYFFGVLHSYIHEIWSLRLGTSLEDRPRYTPTTTFETFPFPWSPGQEDVNSPAYLAISAAAKALHEERELWLNPPELIALGAEGGGSTLRERTLTNLYNALVDLRNGTPAKNGKNAAAVAFAPRLRELHDALDAAVLSAYGWSDLSPLSVYGEGPGVRFEGEGQGARAVGAIRSPEGDEELLRRLLALNAERANQQDV